MFVAIPSVQAIEKTDNSLLQKENQLLKKQVNHLKAMLTRRDKELTTLTERIQQFHEELVTQNQIEVQILKTMSNISETAT